ncbi:unnamed protein product [Toxocara canis]|uniref:Uncharacterized protein n=1 Tax=Toxocara canis TaxID=6265 RepID=A0A183TXV1_TOXCA|nr:unnamed protein product [Toxocara canis]
MLKHEVALDMAIVLFRTGTSCKESSPPVEVVPEKVVASGVKKGRENLLVGGGHSARVGMVLEKATRIRAKFEHEERLRNEGKALLARGSVAHDTAQPTSSSHSDYTENRKIVDGYLKGLGSKIGGSSPNVRPPEKELPHSRKRILDLPIPKTVSLDLVGEILAPKQTQVERYIPSKPTTSGDASPLLTTFSSPRTSSHLLHQDLSTSSTDTTPTLHNSPSVSGYSQLNEALISSGCSDSTKKPRLDGSAINNVLNALHNWRH